jgi:hypothetical protein
VAEQIITEVKAILSAQDKDFTSTFQSASAQMQTFNKTAAALGAVTAGVGFGLIKLGKSAFNEASRVQELDIAMKAIGRSTGLGYEAINKASNGIRKMGIELGASQQIAIEFAQNNLEMAKAADVARVAQDLAVIGQKNSTDTTQLLTRAIITGRTELLKSSGIQKSAGQMYEEFAAKAGKSAQSLTAVEKQTAVLNGVLKEGEKVFGTYEAAMLAPGKVMRSFKRITNDISVELGKSVVVGFGPVIKSAYDMVKAFGSAMRENEGFKNALGALGVILTRLAAPLVNMFDYLKDFIEGIEISNTQITNFTTTLQKFLPVILTVAAAITTFAGQSLLRGIPGLAGFAGALNPIMAGFVALAATSPALRTELMKLYEVFRPMIPVLLEVGSAIAKTLAQALSIGISALRIFVQAMGYVIPAAMNWIKSHEVIFQVVKNFGLGLFVVIGAIMLYNKYMLIAAALTGGKGLMGAIMILRNAIVTKLIPSLTLAVGALRGLSIAQGIATVASYITAGAITALKWALRMFLASSGIGLIIVGVGFLAERLLKLADSANGASDSFGNMEGFSADLEAQMTKLQDAFSLDLPAGLDATVAGMDEAAQKTQEMAAKAKELKDRIAELKKGVNEAVKSFGDFVFAQKDTRNLSQKLADGFALIDTKMKDTKISADDLLRSFQDFTSTMQQDFSEALSTARTQLDNARQAFNDFRDVISSSIKKVVNFEKAVEGGDFLAGLIQQADNATKFSEKVRKLIEMGLSESAITQVVEAGYDAGVVIADQIIAGGQTVVDQVNKLVASVTLVADSVGYFGAEKFYQAGVDQANALVNGILEQMNNRYADVQAMVDKLAAILSEKARLEQLADTGGGSGGGSTGNGNPPSKSNFVKGTSLTQKEIDDITRNSAASTSRYNAMASFYKNNAAPKISGTVASLSKSSKSGGFLTSNMPNLLGLAKGGIVTQPTIAMIGEKGAEAVVPLNRASGIGGTSYTINVSAGIGTNGAEVGKQIVEAIKKFERSSGPVFAKA